MSTSPTDNFFSDLAPEGLYSEAEADLTSGTGKKDKTSPVSPKDSPCLQKSKPNAPSLSPAIAPEKVLATAIAPHKKKDKPQHLGHRERLRVRFVEGGKNALADYEMLEMLLFLGIPRKDTKPLAKDLIAYYKRYSAVLAAPYHELLDFKGMTKNAAAALKLVESSAHRMMKQDMIGHAVLNSWDRLIDYCTATMAEEKKEHFRILFLDRKNNLLADEIQQSGTVDQTPVYPREVVKRALELSATALVLVHNHPSGDTSPSEPDIEMTHDIIEAARPLDILIHDHLIISRTGYTSMKAEGLMG